MPFSSQNTSTKSNPQVLFQPFCKNSINLQREKINASSILFSCLAFVFFCMPLKWWPQDLGCACKLWAPEWSCGVKASLQRENGAFIWHALPHFPEIHKTCLRGLEWSHARVCSPTNPPNRHPNEWKMDETAHTIIMSYRKWFNRYRLIARLIERIFLSVPSFLLECISNAQLLVICLCYHWLALNHPPAWTRRCLSNQQLDICEDVWGVCTFVASFRLA